MNLRNVLALIDEAQDAGDLQSASPVFAVVRNTAAALESPEAWHAISIVDVAVDSARGMVRLLTDDAQDAQDITVASLRARAAKLSADVREYDVLISAAFGADDSSSADGIPVVEAYSDEHGLGLMARFEGYDGWLLTQS